jgi:hypothetical protein
VQEGPGWSADFPSSASSAASSQDGWGRQPQLARAPEAAGAADVEYAEPPAFPVFNFLSQARDL